MGMMSAIAMADEVGVTEATLSWHFTSNCYPPVPSIMIAPALAAIAAFNDEDDERTIRLPDPVTYAGSSTVPAWKLVDSFHLHAFIGV